MRRSLFLPLLAMSACNPAPADKDAPAAPQAASPAGGASVPIGAVDRSNSGQPAPAVPFEVDAGGETKTIADYKGRRVLVNLWATWCAPCIKELPTLDALQKRAGDRLLVLPISQDMEGWRKVNTFWTPGKYPNLRTVLDSQMAFGQAIKARGLPVTILYDEQGRELWRKNGDFDWSSDEAAKLLDV